MTDYFNISISFFVNLTITYKTKQIDFITLVQIIIKEKIKKTKNAYKSTKTIN